MPEKEQDMDLGELIDDADLKVLEDEAKRRGKTLAETAKFGMQKVIADRTRPSSMSGVIQAFRKK